MDTPPSKSPLMRYPSEILQLIASSLPLRSAINLHASSRRLSSLVNPTRRRILALSYPRIYTVSWFWEEMLKTLTASRCKILKGAEPYWQRRHISSQREDLKRRIIVAKMLISRRILLSLGLQNRQIICMCVSSPWMSTASRQKLEVNGECSLKFFR